MTGDDGPVANDPHLSPLSPEAWRRPHLARKGETHFNQLAFDAQLASPGYNSCKPG